MADPSEPSDTRLIVVDDRWDSGGIGGFNAAVIEGLAGRGLDIRRLGDGRTYRRVSRATPLRPLAISSLARRHRNATFLSAGYFPPARWTGPSVVTIHDLQYLDPAAGSDAIRRAYFRHVLGPLYRRCSLILTVSQESGEAIEEFLGGTTPVSVVGEGIDDRFFGPAGEPRPDDDRARNPDRALRVTYVGNWMAHKRVDLLIAACGTASERHPIQLHLPADPPPKMARLIDDERRRSRERLGVELRPKLSCDELAAHLRANDVLVQLSSHEGFGLPPIEAQASGTPVVVTSYPGARDRLGPTGAHYLPHHPTKSEVVDVLTAVAADETLRTSTIPDGRLNAARWAWPAALDRIQRAIEAL